jgi:signal transduction histidine kinase
MTPFRLDVLVAGAFLAEALLEVLVVGAGTGQRPEAALGVTLMAAGLLVRRRLPLVAVALVLAAFVLLQWVGPPISDETYSPFFVLLFVMYSAGVHLPDRAVPGAIALAFGGITVGVAVDVYTDTIVDYVFGGAVLAGGPLLLGRLIRNRSRLNRTLRERTERLRRERELEVDRATAQERGRIAGELHDVVAHALSAMVVQSAGARRLAERDPERARAAFATVETTGREALTEIRRLLGVLRRDDEEIGLAPQPSLRHLPALVRRSAAAGLPVELAVEGDERPLPAGVDLTAYRLVQAALGGALEQGGAGRAQVTVRYRPDGVDVEVLDDGGAGDGPRPLPGVRERVGLYGGQLHAERERSGGHAVRARLPVGAGS